MMTSTNQHVLFTGGYAETDQPGIQVMEFDSETGELTSLGSFAGILNPSFLVLHENGQWLYAVSETGLASHGTHGAVWALKIDRESYTLQSINHQSTNGDWPCHLAIDASGRWLLASNYGSGDAAVYPILEDGRLGEMNDFVQHSGHGPNQVRQKGPHAHSATLTPDNRFAIVADLGIDQLVIYAFDVETGKLKQHGVMKTHPGAGPRHITFNRGGDRLYVANELNSTVAVYAYDAGNGTLSELQVLDTLASDAPQNIVADIHLSPDGQRLYVSNRGDNSMAVFAVDADGLLARVAIQSCGGDWPRNFKLAPGGRFLLVANERSDEIAVLPIQVGTAELGDPVARAAATKPTCVQWY